MFLILFSYAAAVGAEPTLQERYEKAIDRVKGTFRCFDSKKEIPLSQMNDNNVDCDDGSDEIGTAYGTGSFFCRNEGYISYSIPRWSVGDGICDCCDGSDEIFNKHSNCTNNCAELEAKRKQLIKLLTDGFREGMNESVKLREKGLEIEKELKKQKDEENKIIDKLNLRIEAIKSGEEPVEVDKNDEKGFIYKFIVYLWKYTFFIDESDFIPSLEKLISKAKEAKISSVNDEIEEHRRNINTITYKYGNKNISAEFLPIYDEEFQKDTFKFNFMVSFKDDFMSIGNFDKIENKTIYLTEGSYCWETQNSRKSQVKMMCWKENKLISAMESEKCSYSAIFATPSVCDNDDIEAIQNMTVEELQNLIEMLDLSTN